MPDQPPAIPPSLPPLYRDQRKVDADHLRLLSIFSFISAGLALVGVLFLLFHYSMMHMVMSNPQMWQQPGRPAVPPPFDPRQFFAAFIWFYLVFGAWGVVMSLLNVVAGFALRAHKHRTFTLVVAGLNCLRVPLGTTLAVFTFIVLLRDSVRELYEAEALRPPR